MVTGGEGGGGGDGWWLGEPVNTETSVLNQLLKDVNGTEYFDYSKR